MPELDLFEWAGVLMTMAFAFLVVILVWVQFGSLIGAITGLALSCGGTFAAHMAACRVRDQTILQPAPKPFAAPDE